MVKKRTCVFISGQGTNLKNLIICSRHCNFPIKISLIISNNKELMALIIKKVPNLYIYKYKKPIIRE